MCGGKGVGEGVPIWGRGGSKQTDGGRGGLNLWGEREGVLMWGKGRVKYVGKGLCLDEKRGRGWSPLMCSTPLLTVPRNP